MYVYNVHNAYYEISIDIISIDEMTYMFYIYISIWTDLTYLRTDEKDGIRIKKISNNYNENELPVHQSTSDHSPEQITLIPKD